jgi:hypothetical protein
MISREQTVVFVWRCTGCVAVYDGENVLFLHTDGANRYCRCGKRLVEDLAPVAERHFRLVIPEPLWGTALHRQLDGRGAGEAVEVTVGGREKGHIDVLCTG